LSDNVTSTRIADTHWPLRVSIAILAFLAAVMVLIMAWGLRRYLPKPESFHHGQIKSPVLALELASDRNDLIEVLQTINPALTLSWPNGCGFEIRRGPICALRINTLQDCVFIPLYAGFLLCMALLFSMAPRRLWLGLTGAALAIAAAVFDYAENRGIFKALGTDALTDQTALAISSPSRMKWTLLGLNLLFLGVLICISRLTNFRAWVRWVLSVGYWIAGLMLLAATARLSLFALATPLFGLVIVISAGGLLGPFFKRPAKPLDP
jgi:hypothetical protein